MCGRMEMKYKARSCITTCHCHPRSVLLGISERLTNQTVINDFVVRQFVVDSSGAEGQLCVFGEKRSGGGGRMH